MVGYHLYRWWSRPQTYLRIREDVLIALFRASHFDLLVAGRCAPGQSWMNPVERIMSLLNLALQNVALERDASSMEVEGVYECVLRYS